MAAITGQVGTVLGPLTTSWSMPDRCTVHFVTCATCDQAYRAQHCVANGATGPVEDDLSCWPPVLTQIVGTPTHPFIGLGLYSPGWACPTGYTTACTAEYGRRAGWDIQFPLVADETAIGCCPPGFTCTNRNGNTCIAVITTGTQTVVNTAMCSGAQVVSQARETFPDIITTTATTTTSSGGAAALQTVTREVTLFAPMFQLNYRPTDLASASTSSQTTTAPPSDTKSSATSSASSNTQPTPDPSSSGLSTGAIAGIGVGAALGGIFLGAVAILLLLRHRRRRNAAAAGPPSQEPPQEQQHGGGGAWTGVGEDSGVYHNWKYAAQMPAHSQVGSELAADQDRYEVWGGATPVELAAGPGNGLVGHAHNPNRG